MNVRILWDVLKLLRGRKTKLVLYTYDSFLFDYDMKDGKDTILLLKDIISEQGKYPVKLKAGVNYNVMKDMTSKAV